ncbi:hypothetical protein GCM10022215_35980 [Nocardioides fonticola]|uniref:Uncharacterized protein n=1 Tax=Nocardioides fonticola TaxID=450363 RepID=A0ABP7XV59_9ACTN
MVFVILMVVLVVIAAIVVGNARARRNLEALHRPPQDVRRAEDHEDPPSSSGYRGSTD